MIIDKYSLLKKTAVFKKNICITPFHSHLLDNFLFYKFSTSFFPSKCTATKANKALQESMLHHKAINKGSRTNQTTSCI